MSQGCINYNCTDELGAQRLSDCGRERQGGAWAMLLVECGSVLSNPASGTEINALISAGNAVLVRNVNVSYDYASPIQVDSNIPCAPQRTVNYDRTGVIVDRNVNDLNRAFWDQVFKNRVFSSAVIFECGNDDEQKVKFIRAQITFTGSDRLPNTDNEFQDIRGEFKWKSLQMPSIYNYPVGVNGL